MLSILSRKKQHEEKVAPPEFVGPPDPWAGMNDVYYINAYRHGLESIARELSTEEEPIWSCFVWASGDFLTCSRNCAQIRSVRRIIAEVEVYGEAGSPYAAKVVLDPEFFWRRGLLMRIFPRISLSIELKHIYSEG